MKSYRDIFSVLAFASVIQASAVRAQQPLEDNVKLSYYDGSNQKISVLAPEVYGTVALVALSERFTLPKTSAYLDSVRIHLDSVEGERLMIRIQRDTLIPLSGTDHHFINSAPNATIFSGEISIEEIGSARDIWLTIPLPHIRVPQEFHVVISGIQTGPQDFSSRFWLFGDRFYDQGPTPNSRSGYFASINPDDLGDTYVGLMDGFFTLNGLPLAIEFHIEAFVDVTSSSVNRTSAEPASVYPNPVASNSLFHVVHPKSMFSVRMLNILGEEVMNWEGSSNRLDLPTDALPTGIYKVLIQTREAYMMEKVIVQ